MQSNNSGNQNNTALGILQNSIGRAAFFRNNLTNHNGRTTVLEVLQGGVSIGGNTGNAHGGFFAIRNNSSTASAIRGEIEGGLTGLNISNTAQAGSFLINLNTNTATALSTQTVGLGRAADFFD